ncbi:MAG: DUF1566 domain-containing protein [Deltaproteobacteria bacterium]|nr:DUF1566 domain-containing protein [Deltaproteobacteria bacterium]
MRTTLLICPLLALTACEGVDAKGLGLRESGMAAARPPLLLNWDASRVPSSDLMLIKLGPKSATFTAASGVVTEGATGTGIRTLGLGPTQMGDQDVVSRMMATSAAPIEVVAAFKDDSEFIAFAWFPTDQRIVLRSGGVNQVLVTRTAVRALRTWHNLGLRVRQNGTDSLEIEATINGVPVLNTVANGIGLSSEGRGGFGVRGPSKVDYLKLWGCPTDQTFDGSACVPGNAPPQVSLLSPRDADLVSGAVEVLAELTDDHGVDHADLLVDGTLVQTLATAPFSFAWNSCDSGDGPHTLTVRATDTGGLTREASIGVTASAILLAGWPGDDKAVLSWSANCPGTVTSFRLYWSNAPGVSSASTPIDSVNSPSSHNGLVSGSPRYFRIARISGTSVAGLSNEVVITPHSCTDGVQDGEETGKDCGGPACRPCAQGEWWSRPATWSGSGSWSTTTDVALDTVKDLHWQRVQSSSSYTWTNAIAYCDSLVLGGYSDWRLPTVMELMSIMDYGRTPKVNPTLFPNTSATTTWTIAPYAQNPELAWLILFDSGLVGTGYKTSPRAVRCVR